MKKILLIYAIMAIIFLPEFSSAASLIITSGTTTSGGNLVYDSVYVASGATLRVNGTGWINITTTSNITILGTLDGLGNAGGTPGSGGIGDTNCYGRGATGGNGLSQDGRTGGYGGQGGSTQFDTGDGSPGGISDVIGTQTGRYEVGIIYTGGASGGGGGGGASVPASPCSGSYVQGGNGGTGTGYGGSSIRLYAPNITINGTITSSGSNSGGSGGIGASGLYYIGFNGGQGGGASAGEIIIEGNRVNLTNAILAANGGTGGISGAGGRIKVFYKNIYNTSSSASASGGVSGTVYYENINNYPSIIQNNPINGQSFTTTNWTVFNCTSNDTDDYVKNISLYINGILNYTATGTSTFLGLWRNYSLPDGNYNYQCSASDNYGLTNYSNTYSFIVSVNKVALSMTSPTGKYSYGYDGGSLILNWTAYSGIGLSACWFNYNNTNTFVNCGSNGTYFNQSAFSKKQLTFYSNDTLNNVSSLSTNWDYSLFENSINYNSITLSRNKESFSINLTYDNNSYSSINAYFVYNNTAYSTVKIGSGSNIVYNSTIYVPSVYSAINESFYWSIYLTNSSGTLQLNSTFHNQTISPLYIDNCTSYSKAILNFSLYDEDDRTALNGNIEVSIDLFAYQSTNEVISFNTSFTNVNKASICISQLNSSYSMDYKTRYYNASYSSEYKYGQSITLTNSTPSQLIDLYDLLSSRSTAFVINVKSQDLSSLSGAIVDIQRQFISINQFLSVESPITDANGKTVGHFVAKDAVYNFVIIKEGILIGSFNNYIVKCQNELTSDCSIDLNIAQSTIHLDDFLNYGNLSIDYSLDRDTRILTTNFVTTDSQVHTIRIDVIKNNNTVCSNTNIGTSGTILCTIPQNYGNTSFYAEVYSDNNLIGKGYFDLSTSSTDIFRGVRVVLGMLMYSTITLMFMGHPIMIIIGAILGMIFAGAFHIVDGGTFLGDVTIISFFIIAGGIIIYIIAKRT